MTPYRPYRLLAGFAGLALLALGAAASPLAQDSELPQDVQEAIAAFAAKVDVHELLGDGKQLRPATLNLAASAAAMKTPSTLLEEFGYPTEVYTVETEDGYRLRLDRVPNKGRPVIYLAHALETSAAAFLVLGPKKALALLLHDAGYDVWLANFRGTKYSRSHKLLSSNEKVFWDFSWHEHGYYDNTANIDFILKETGKANLVYIGHSMGTTSFLVTGSSRPEYQDKIKAAFLLAPVASIAHHRSPFVSMLNTFVRGYEFVLGSARDKETQYNIYSKIANKLCHSLGNVCYGALDLVVGRNPKADYWTAIPELFNYIPAGGSNGQILHYLQLTNKKNVGFRMYDYGKRINKKMYGLKSPPSYPLWNIKIPVHLYSGASDILVDSKDLDLLRTQLPNVKTDFIAEDQHFNHVDFIFGSTAKEQIFDALLDDIAKYTK